MSDQEQPTQTEPTADEQQQITLPPTQFLMFPEGFRVNPMTTPIGDCLGVTGVQFGQVTTVEATWMVPIEQVEALCELMLKEKQKAVSPTPDIVRASADTDLAALAAEARRRSGL